MRGETVTVTRLGAEDPNNRDELGYPIPAESTTFDIEHVAVALSGTSGTSESAESTGDLSITGYTLYMPSGTQLRSTDILTIRGVTGWQVEGDAFAGQWTSPFSGRGKGVEARVKRAS